VSIRWIAALFIIALAPATAAAQFTTFIAPPNPQKDSALAVVAAEQKAVADSVTRAQIQNMKVWVDSAAGIVIPPTDTAFAVQTVTTTTEIPGGMVAPATASAVPFLLATGIAGMLLGLVMLRRPRPKPKRYR
jgi:hypothetical protein